MPAITIPKKFIPKEEDLIILPRFEYEALLKRKGIKEIKLTVRETRAIRESEKEFEKGDYLTFDEFKKYLENPHSKSRRKSR